MEVLRILEPLARASESTCRMMHKRIVPLHPLIKRSMPGSAEVMQREAPSRQQAEGKSLTDAFITVGEGKRFDTVAVGFWLAALSRGCNLVVVKKSMSAVELAERHVVSVKKDGKIWLTCHRTSIFGKPAKSAEVISTRVENPGALEFTLRTSNGFQLMRAPDEEWFTIWTRGMDSIFRYSKALKEAR